jgi:hypothetical protein
MNNITLWQVNLDQTLAFFDKSIIEIVTDGVEIDVPYCHAHMNKMLIWREQWIPILRLNEQHTTLVILNTQGVEDCPYLALAVGTSPEKVNVTDRDFLIDAAEFLPAWQQAAISAVTLAGIATPILNPAKFMNDAWLQTLDKQTHARYAQ